VRAAAARSAALALLVLAGVCLGADRTTERRYKLFDQGVLLLRAPADWEDELREAPPSHPPTIQFQPSGGKPFRVFVTPIWRSRPEIPLPSRDWLRERVERSAEKLGESALEKRIEVVAFRGRSGPGFYFSATHKAPRPGELPHLTQGMMQVSELLVTFTILTGPGQKLVVRDALTMLRGASHVPPQ